ncbi:MAG TPA: DUF5711 family protein [Tissierellaceae bacterium]|nr:DUF5711 family protein [Tissierellaceae bacterium]
MENNKDNRFKKIKLFIAFVLLAILIIISNKNNQRKILEFVNSFNKGEKTLELINYFDNHNIIDVNIYKNTIAIWEENRILFTNRDGELILEKNFNFIEPAIYYGEKYIYPYDKATGDIYFFHNNGSSFEKLQLGKEIFNIKERNGYLMCHLKAGNIEKIDILDKDWTLIGSPTFDDKNILSYDINKRGTKILVSLLNLNNDRLKSEIYYYGENNEEQGSLTIEGEIILFNELIKDNSQVILTDKALYYVKDEEIVWEKSFNLIKDIYIFKDTIYLLHGNYLEAINLKGEIKNAIGFTENYNSISNFNGNTLVYGDEKLAVVKNGELILEHEEFILKAYTNGIDLLILGPDSLNIYELINKE